MSDKPKVLMIVVNGDEISTWCSSVCIGSWRRKGYEVEIFNAVTPIEIREYNYLKFTRSKKRRTQTGGVQYFSPTEKSICYSHFEALKKCVEDDTPYIIAEHDVHLVKDIDNNLFETKDFVSFRGEKELDFKDYPPLKGIEHNKYKDNSPPTGCYYVTPRAARGITLSIEEISCNMDGMLENRISKLPTETTVESVEHQIIVSVKHPSGKTTIDHNNRGYKLPEKLNVDKNIYMIQNQSDEVSRYYTELVLPSWEKHGYEINMFEAVYPPLGEKHQYLNFGKYKIGNAPEMIEGGREHTESEKAGWYSHLELWRECYNKGEPIAIIEHDVMCVKPLHFPMTGMNFFCSYANYEEWKNYAQRFNNHPYWGEQHKIVPVTHAYTITPQHVETFVKDLEKIQSEGQVDNFVDDFLINYRLSFQTIHDVKSSIYNYTKPIYHENIGGSMEHGKI